MVVHRCAAVVGFLSLALLGSCETASRPDLRYNEGLYRSPGYHAKLPADKAVFIAPLRDERDPTALPASSGAFPIIYDRGGRWERPLTEMVEDILVDELRDSGVFTAVLRTARSDALVLIPSLVRLNSGNMETIEGGQSLAEAAIRIQVWGAAAAGSERKLIFDEVFADREVSSVAMAPTSTFHLMGRVLYGTMGALVSNLDSSNIARSGVPLEAVGIPGN